MDQAVHEFATRGDLAHLALALWAMAASALAAWALRELVAASKRFDAFVNEIARLNRLFDDPR
jgi:ABC-type proline/glycine betaine transport system permease subunit